MINEEKNSRYNITNLLFHKHTDLIFVAENVGERICRALRHSSPLAFTRPPFTVLFLKRSGKF